MLLRIGGLSAVTGLALAVIGSGAGLLLAGCFLFVGGFVGAIALDPGHAPVPDASIAVEAAIDTEASAPGDASAAA